MEELKKRVQKNSFRNKITSPEKAADFIKDGMTVATSGFTPAGYPKEVPLALAKKAEKKPLKINLLTGASVGEELDGALSKACAINKRIPYQTNDHLREAINCGEVKFVDMHLSHMPQMVRYGSLGKIDIALVELVAIKDDGRLVLSTSVGNTPTFLREAEKIILEVNSSQPLQLEGIHDIYIPEDPPNRQPIPLVDVSDRIGTPYIEVDEERVVAVVFSDKKDVNREFAPPDEVSEQIAKNLISFLKKEVKEGRIPDELLPFQSGVGSIANAILKGLAGLGMKGLKFYSEVIQDSVLDLLEEGSLGFASGTSLTLSPAKLDYFNDNYPRFKEKIILRPQEISNNPELIRRLGVIAMNTAIEVDIYGNVNSTHILGRRMMNGIGGSGDFSRNAYLSIFTTPSVRKGGKISCIVPRASHIDHTEHDVQVIVTEQGVADLRGASPQEKAEIIINNCAHPNCREDLEEYFSRCKKEGFGHTPCIGS